MRIARLAASLSVAALLVAPGLAQEAAPFPGQVVVDPANTGEFLAGQQAFYELHTTQAARYLLDAAYNDWDNPVLVSRAMEAVAADGDIDAAADIAEHLLDIAAGSDIARIILAAQALKERRYVGAQTEVDAILEGSLTTIVGDVVKAWALVGLERYDEADALMVELGGQGIANFLYLHRSMMADISGQTEEAIELGRQAFEVDPSVPRFVEGYARLLADADRYDEAAEVLAAYEARGLRHPVLDAIKLQVNADIHPGMLATTVQEGAAEMFHAIAVELARDGLADSSIMFMKLGLYLHPGSDLMRIDLAQLMQDRELYAESNEVYEEISLDSPLRAQAVVRVAGNLDAMGLREEAIRRLTEVAATEPENYDAQSALGDLLRADERFEESIAAYTQLIDSLAEERASNWFYYYLRGIAYERAGEWPLAEADFLRSLELSPNQPRVLNYLGYSWVDKGLNLEQALRMIERAVAAQPSNGSIVDSLGWAYYRLGRFEEAVTALEAAARLEPESAEINDHLGDAYWQVGRFREARFQWNIAGDIDTSGLIKPRADMKLVQGLDAVEPVDAVIEDISADAPDAEPGAETAN